MGGLRSGAKAVFAAVDMVGRRPTGPRVVIYHQVSAGLGRQIEVSEPVFVRQLTWLAANFEIVDLDEAVARWGEPGAQDLAVLTFDDGYLDTYTIAYPHLRERSLPFVVYVATEAVETRRPHGPKGTEPLEWEHLETMLDSGLLTVGAHTHTHPDVREISRESVRDELGTSNEIIEKRLGVDPKHFAYPYGFWSDAAEVEVSSLYETAVIGATMSPPEHPDRLRLHRYPVQLSDGFVFFKARMRRGLRFEEVVRRRIQGYQGP